MTGIVTLTAANPNTGPFNLYSDTDGFIVPFQTNVPRASLLVGYPVSNIPDGTTDIRIRSMNEVCGNYTDIIVPTTTTTTTV